MKKKPQLSIRGRGILIQIKDTLKENTTYALNFGSAVRDNNEGNPLYSMRYVFSTARRWIQWSFRDIRPTATRPTA